MTIAQVPIGHSRARWIWWALIIGNGLIFAGLVLGPFAVRATQTIFSVGSSLVGWGPHGAIEGPPQITIGWLQPAHISALSLGGVIANILMGSFILWYIRRLGGYRHMKQMSVMYLVIAAVTIVVTCSAYAVLRQHSQAVAISARSNQAYVLHDSHARQRCAWITINASQSFNFSDTSCKGATVVAQPRFGFGILPVYLIVQSVVYGLPALLTWYRLRLSPSRVGGQKKDILFQ